MNQIVVMFKVCMIRSRVILVILFIIFHFHPPHTKQNVSNIHQNPHSPTTSPAILAAVPSPPQFLHKPNPDTADSQHQRTEWRVWWAFIAFHTQYIIVVYT